MARYATDDFKNLIQDDRVHRDLCLDPTSFVQTDDLESFLRVQQGLRAQGSEGPGQRRRERAA